MDLLHYLRTFVCLAEKRTMARATESLLISQPTVSTHIAGLEKYYGCCLLEFRNRQYFLTEEGDCLREFALRILGLEGETAEAMAEFTSLGRGTLALGASSNIGVYSLPPVLSRFRECCPGVKLNVFIDRNSVIEREVLDYKLAVGLVEADVADPGLRVEVFRREPLALVVAPGHPWAGRATVRACELAGQPFVVGEPGSGTRRVLARQLGAAADRLNAVLQMGSTEAVKKAVENSLGVSIVVRAAVERELALKTLAAVPIDGVELFKEYKIICRRDRHMSGGAKRFMAVLRAFFGG